METQKKILKKFAFSLISFFLFLIEKTLNKLSNLFVNIYQLLTTKIDTPDDGMEAVAIIMMAVFMSILFHKPSGEWLILMVHTCIAIASLYTIWGWKHAVLSFIRKYSLRPSYGVLIAHGMIALALVPAAHGLSKSYIETYINISTGLPPQYFPNATLILNIIGSFFSYLTIIVLFILILQVWYSLKIFLWSLWAFGQAIVASFKNINDQREQEVTSNNPTMLNGISSFLKMAVCFYIAFLLGKIEIEQLPSPLYFPGKLVVYKFDHYSISPCSNINLNSGQRIKSLSSHEVIISTLKNSEIKYEKASCTVGLLTGA